MLVLYSYNELIPWQARIHAALQERLEKTKTEDRPDIFEEHLDSTRIDLSITAPAMTAYLKAKYSSFTFDAVIAECYGTLRVLLQNPELFAGARRYAIDPGAAVSTTAGDIQVIQSQSEWARPSLLDVLDVMPHAQRIVAIVDHSPVGETLKRQLLADAAALPGGIRFDVCDDFTFDGLLDGVAGLPPRVRRCSIRPSPGIGRELSRSRAMPRAGSPVGRPRRSSPRTTRSLTRGSWAAACCPRRASAR